MNDHHHREVRDQEHRHRIARDQMDAIREVGESSSEDRFDRQLEAGDEIGEKDEQQDVADDLQVRHRPRLKTAPVLPLIDHIEGQEGDADERVNEQRRLREGPERHEMDRDSGRRLEQEIGGRQDRQGLFPFVQGFEDGRREGRDSRLGHGDASKVSRRDPAWAGWERAQGVGRRVELRCK